MDLAIQNTTPNFQLKIKPAVDLFKISKLEKLLSDMLEEMPNNTPLDYVGELNRNDVMH